MTSLLEPTPAEAKMICEKNVRAWVSTVFNCIMNEPNPGKGKKIVVTYGSDFLKKKFSRSLKFYSHERKRDKKPDQFLNDKIYS